MVSFCLQETLALIEHTLLLFLVVTEAFNDRRVEGVGKLLFDVVGFDVSQDGEGDVDFWAIGCCDV